MNPATIAIIVSGAIEIIKLAPKWVADAKGRGELTPELEAELDKRIAELDKLPHWKVEP